MCVCTYTIRFDINFLQVQPVFVSVVKGLRQLVITRIIEVHSLMCVLMCHSFFVFFLFSVSRLL